LIKNVQFR